MMSISAARLRKHRASRVLPITSPGTAHARAERDISTKVSSAPFAKLRISGSVEYLRGGQPPQTRLELVIRAGAPERFDLLLGTTVKRALTAPQDAVLAEEFQHLANNARPEGRERDDRRCESLEAVTYGQRPVAEQEFADGEFAVCVLL